MSRQVGVVIGGAIMATLVGNQQIFLSGMHLTFVITGVLLLLALVAAWSSYQDTTGDTFNVDTVEQPRRITRPAEIALGTKSSHFKD